MPLVVETFFDLSRSTHQALLSGPFVWSPLHDLMPYLSAWSQFKIECPIPEGVYLVRQEFIAIAADVVIEPGAYIEGPCIIGPGCTIRHGAYVRAGVILEEGCSVGHAAEVKHSILLRGAAATHFTYVGDSILGAEVNLGAGVKCANLRLDRDEIRIQGVPTGLRKMGAIVGDGSQIGCNSVLNPGTLIGPNCLVPPLSNVGGTKLCN